MFNVVVVQGVVARPGQEVALSTGQRLLNLELSVRQEGEPPEAVPGCWFDPAGWASDLAPGTPLAVLGRVRRRFFRSGGSTQSRTEVVATRVVRASARAKVRALVDEAVEAIDGSVQSGSSGG